MIQISVTIKKMFESHPTNRNYTFNIKEIFVFTSTRKITEEKDTYNF